MTSLPPDRLLAVLQQSRDFLLRVTHGVWTDRTLSHVAGINAAILLVERIGMAEEPAGSNRGPVVEELRRWAGRPLDDDNAGPWCAYAVAGCHKEAVRRLSQELGIAIELVSPTSGSTARWWQKGAKKGLAVRSDQWHTTPPPPGAFIARVGKSSEDTRDRLDLWAGGSGGDHNHTFLSVACYSGQMLSCEGNTNGSGSRNGGEVWSKRYQITEGWLAGHVPLTVRRSP